MSKLVNLVKHHGTDIVKYLHTLRSFRINSADVNKSAALAIAPYAAAAFAVFFGTLYVAKTLIGRVRTFTKEMTKPPLLPPAQLTELFSKTTGIQKETVQLDQYEVSICFNPTAADCYLNTPHKTCSPFPISLWVKKKGQDKNFTNKELSHLEAGPLQEIISQIPDAYKGKYTIAPQQTALTSEEALKLFSEKTEIQRKVFEYAEYEMLVCFNPKSTRVDCRLEGHILQSPLPVLLVVKKKNCSTMLSDTELSQLRDRLIAQIPDPYKNKCDLRTTGSDLRTVRPWKIT